jgi:hypothetical protein
LRKSSGRSGLTVRCRRSVCTSKLSELLRRRVVKGRKFYRKSFSSKKEGWDVKKIRCATCFRWLDHIDWDTAPVDVVEFCSRDCELYYLNSEEENIVY